MRRERRPGRFPRYTIRCLTVLIALAAVLLGGFELERRRRTAHPRPPLSWPWVPAVPGVSNSSNLYVNAEDIEAGIDPPRAKYVHEEGPDRYRIEDAPGAPGWSKNLLPFHRY
jgi:hypothetical protein